MKEKGFGIWYRKRGNKTWRKTLYFAEKKSWLMPYAQKIAEDFKSIGYPVEIRFPHVKYKNFRRGRPAVISKEQAEKARKKIGELW